MSIPGSLTTYLVVHTGMGKQDGGAAHQEEEEVEETFDFDHNFTREQINEYREAFSLFDKDGDGATMCASVREDTGECERRGTPPLPGTLVVAARTDLVGTTAGTITVKEIGARPLPCACWRTGDYLGHRNIPPPCPSARAHFFLVPIRCTRILCGLRAGDTR